MLEVLTPGGAFLLGLLASVSTCLAVVGGLVLSLSARLAVDSRAAPRVFVLFHVGRIGGFALLGGVLGALGGALMINEDVITALNVMAGVVMLILGLNLVGVLDGKSVKLPRAVFLRLSRLEDSLLAAAALGVATFFFPCGFTQAAQVAALASGSFMAGAAIMLAFALGTLPMLLALSFGTTALASKVSSRYFFKAAGVVVIGFALFALWSSAASMGLVPSLGQAARERDTTRGEIREGVQYAVIHAHDGYSPERVVLKAGTPAVLEVVTSGTYDCSAGLRIPALGIREYLPTSGRRQFDLGVRQAGDRIEGRCAMGMYGFEITFE